MAKKAVKKNVDKKSEEDLFADLAEESNGDILSDLETVSCFFDTGNLAFNYVCSGRFIDGGIPNGRITEIYGPEASGKTLIANNALFGCQKLNGIPVIIDCENATNAEFMERASHLNPKKVIRQTPETLEKAFLKIHTMILKIREKFPLEIPILFVYDSITVSPCEREFKETDLPEDYTPADWKRIVGRQEQPGERAKIYSREFRKLNPKLAEMNATLIVINQTRDKIGVMYGSPETTPGGNALKYYASLRMRTSQKKKIENKDLGTYAGVNMQAKNIKNRMHKPFVVAEDIKLYFESGIDPLSGLLEMLIQDERVKMTSRGWFEVLPDYLPEGKDEYKFRGSKTENSVKLDVVLDCPKLIGASSKEEVEKYLSSFQAAMDNSASGEFEEKEVIITEDGELS